MTQLKRVQANNAVDQSSSIIRHAIWLLGFSLFLPGIAVLQVGNGSSIQLATFASLAVLVLGEKAPLSRSGLMWVLGVSACFVVHFLAMLILGKIIDSYIKAWVFNWLVILPLLAGVVVAAKTTTFEFWIRGYLHGAVFSSAWALAQYLSLSIFKTMPSLLVYPLNSRSFSMRGSQDVGKLLSDGRAFGLTPEPSILFMLLAPALMLAIHRRDRLKILIVLVGLYTTNSMSVLFVMPFVLLYWAWMADKLSFRGFAIIVVSLIGGASIFARYVISEFSISKVDYTANFFGRLANISGNVSLISRANSIRSGIMLAIEHPFLGLGIQSDQLQSELVARSTIVEVNRGINSLFVSQIVWWGLPIALILVLPIVYLAAPRGNTEQRFLMALAFAVIFPTLAMNSYPNLYHYWFFIGAIFPLVVEKRTT